jgi:tetratricopeptide (TPR) repeat protein
MYMQLLTEVASYEALGSRIIKRITLAHAFRQIEQVKELASILINIPIREYQLIAQYYLVWCKCRDLEYRTDALEKIIEQSRTYKAKALISRAAFEYYQGKADKALYFYSEAIKTSFTLSEYIEATRGVAMVKSLEGFSKNALIDLEAIIPIIRYAEPAVYYSVLNSYAVEIGEVGRKEEARNISRIVLASPFAFAYPEWQETAQELKPANRSFIAIGPSKYIKRNVLSMPVVEHGKSEQSIYNAPARVLNLQKWKQKMAKKKDDNKEPTNDREMLMWIMNVYMSDETSDYTRYKIYEAVKKAIFEPEPEPDHTGGA